MKFNPEKGKKELINVAENFGGGVVASILKKKAPESVAKYAPYGILALGLLSQFVDNTHVQAVGKGMAVIGAFQTLKTLEEKPEPTTVPTGTSGLGGLNGSADFLSLINPLSPEIAIDSTSLAGIKLDSSILGLGNDERRDFEFLDEFSSPQLSLSNVEKMPSQASFSMTSAL